MSILGHKSKPVNHQLSSACGKADLQNQVFSQSQTKIVDIKGILSTRIQFNPQRSYGIDINQALPRGFKWLAFLVEGPLMAVL